MGTLVVGIGPFAPRRATPSEWMLMVGSSRRPTMSNTSTAPLRSAMPAATHHPDGDAGALVAQRLAEWERAGLLTHAQAVTIGGFEQARSGPFAPPQGAPTAQPLPHPVAPPRAVPGLGVPVRRVEIRRLPSVAEALGYLGGVLAIVGLVLLLSRVWDTMSSAGRVGLSGGASLVLLAAGFLVPERHPALARLRGFLWFLSTVTAGLCAGVVAVDVFDAGDDLVTASAVSGTVAVHAGSTWAGRPRLLQQVPFLVAIVVTAGALTAQITSDSVAGLVVWAVGITILEVGVLRITPLPAVSEAIGAIALLVGATIVTTDWQGFGQILVTVSAVGLVGLATFDEMLPTRVERRVLAVIGGFAALQAVSSTLVYFARGAGIATGAVTWAIGGALVLLATLPRVRLAIVVTLLGGFALVGGAALCGVQSVAFATLFGLSTAVALIAVGTMPKWALMSVFGSLGLLVNVPWAINHFFPGEGRAPLLIMVSGGVIIGVALLLTRRGGRIRQELTVH